MLADEKDQELILRLSDNYYATLSSISLKTNSQETLPDQLQPQNMNRKRSEEESEETEPAARTCCSRMIQPLAADDAADNWGYSRRRACREEPAGEDSGPSGRTSSTFRLKNKFKI